MRPASIAAWSVSERALRICRLSQCVSERASMQNRAFQLRHRERLGDHPWTSARRTERRSVSQLEWCMSDMFSSSIDGRREVPALSPTSSSSARRITIAGRPNAERVHPHRGGRARARDDASHSRPSQDAEHLNVTQDRACGSSAVDAAQHAASAFALTSTLVEVEVEVAVGDVDGGAGHAGRPSSR
jgi:hypothetical protein